MMGSSVGDLSGRHESQQVRAASGNGASTRNNNRVSLCAALCEWLCPTEDTRSRSDVGSIHATGEGQVNDIEIIQAPVIQLVEGRRDIRDEVGEEPSRPGDDEYFEWEQPPLAHEVEPEASDADNNQAAFPNSSDTQASPTMLTDARQEALRRIEKDVDAICSRCPNDKRMLLENLSKHFGLGDVGLKKLEHSGVTEENIHSVLTLLSWSSAFPSLVPTSSHHIYDEGMDQYADSILNDQDNIQAVLFNLGQLILGTKQYQHAEHVFRIAFELDTSPGAVKQRLPIIHRLGLACYLGYKYEDAVQAFGKALKLIGGELADERLGSELTPYREQEVSIYNCLGVLLYTLGDLPQAREYLNKSLALNNELDPDSSTRARANLLNNIGRVLFSEENYDEALSHYLESVSIRKQQLGDDHPDVAACFYNIADTYLRKSEISFALDTVDKHLAPYAEMDQSVQSHFILSIYINVAKYYHEQNDYETSETYYLKAIDAGVKAHGPKCLEIATVYNKLGNLYYEQRDYDQALKNYSLGLEIEKAKLGPSSPNIQVTLCNIGNAYKAQGQYLLAKQCFKDLYHIQQHYFPDNVLKLKESLFLIAEMDTKLGDKGKALDTYQIALKMLRDKYGDNHSSVAVTMNKIGVLLVETGLSRQAVDYFEKSLRIYSQLSDSAKEIAVACYNLAVCHVNENDIEKAILYYKEAFKIYREEFGVYHLDSIDCMRHVLGFHTNLGEIKEGLDFYEKAYVSLHVPDTEKSQWSKAKHKSLALLYKEVGLAYMKRGDAEQLVDYFSESYRGFLDAGYSEQEAKAFLSDLPLRLYSISKHHPEAAPRA